MKVSSRTFVYDLDPACCWLTCDCHHSEARLGKQGHLFLVGYQLFHFLNSSRGGAANDIVQDEEKPPPLAERPERSCRSSVVLVVRDEHKEHKVPLEFGPMAVEVSKTDVPFNEDTLQAAIDIVTSENKVPEKPVDLSKVLVEVKGEVPKV